MVDSDLLKVDLDLIIVDSDLVGPSGERESREWQGGIEMRGRPYKAGAAERAAGRGRSRD